MPRHPSPRSSSASSGGGAVEWPTVALIGATYAGWVAAGAWLWPLSGAAALAAMTVLAALHSSLVHEALHGHPTRLRGVNEALVFWPLGLVWPYRRFRTLHLRHHRCVRLTDPHLDPESAYQSPERHRALAPWRRRLLAINATLAGRLLLGPPLGAAALIAGDVARLRAGEPGVLAAWLAHLAGLVPVLVVVQAGFGIPAWLYALTVAWGALSLTSLRTFAEHRWHEHPHARSIVVERTALGWLFLNNNLHLVHHAHPSLPWYRLPARYRRGRRAWAAANCGYVVRGYGPLLRAYAFRAKEPVVHPAPADATPARGSA